MFEKFKATFIGDRAFYRSLMVLLVPMVIQQGITNFVSLLDNVMVGRLGTESMSGVAIVNQLLFVFNLTVFGGLAGASIFGAQFFGKGDHHGVRAAFRFKIIFSTVMTVLAIALLAVFGRPLIELFLTDDGSGGDLARTLSEAENYLFVMFFGLVPFAFSQSYSTRGLTVVAATNITNTAWNLFCVIMFAMGNAVSILIGQKLGAGEIEEAKRTDNKLLFFTVALHVFIGVLIALCAPFIPLIYNTEPAVRTLTTQLLLVAGAALPLQAFAHVTYFTIRSGGKTFITFLFDCLYTWVVPLPIAFCLCRFTDLPVVWVYFCVQFADIVKVIIGVCLLRSGIWAKNIVDDTAAALEAE